MMKQWVAGGSGAIALLWASIAFGSWVFLHMKDLDGDFEFPWNQILIALSWAWHDGWHGSATLKTWNDLVTGTVCMIGIPLAVGSVLLRRWLDRRAQPMLYGNARLADARDLHTGGIGLRKRLF